MKYTTQKHLLSLRKIKKLKLCKQHVVHERILINFTLLSMQTKANAELTIKFKQVHQIHFQYESVYSFFLDISQIVSFQILDTITTFAWKNFRNIKLIPYRDICCVVFALFFKLFVGPTFANPFKSHLKYTFLVHSDSLVGFPIKSLAQWKTFKEKNENNCCHASDKEKSELLRGACFPRVEFPAFLEDCRHRLAKLEEMHRGQAKRGATSNFRQTVMAMCVI